ncbi:hypothetical protein TcG_09907, partial [Trypanosoma cruzi]
MTGCGSPVRQAWIIGRGTRNTKFRMYFPPSQSPGQELYPCNNAASIVGQKTMRWQHGSDDITAPCGLRSGALHRIIIDFWLPEELQPRYSVMGPWQRYEVVKHKMNREYNTSYSPKQDENTVAIRISLRPFRAFRV